MINAVELFGKTKNMYLCLLVRLAHKVGLMAQKAMSLSGN